jgi:hypothetical protein
MKQPPKPPPFSTPDRRIRALTARVDALQYRLALVVACLCGLGAVAVVVALVLLVRRLS